MGDNRMHANLDGTQLLERLSAHVLKAFLGPKSRAMIFGAAAGGGFADRVKKLCQALGEGGALRDGEPGGSRAQDGGLDVVGWIPFADGQGGQPILFGQCKTGTRWHESLTRLQPASFAKQWLTEQFLVDPLQAHFIAESIDRQRWREHSIAGGLLFDRCWLSEYGQGVAEPLSGDIAAWTEAALEWLAGTDAFAGGAKARTVY